MTTGLSQTAGADNSVTAGDTMSEHNKRRISSPDPCAICGKRLVLPGGGLACACGALAATPDRDVCTHPDVWDFEHTDGQMGMNGTDHTVECAQAHVDRALKVWGMDDDVRWVVDSIEVHHGGIQEGEHHEPFTVAYGRYEDAS